MTHTDDPEDLARWEQTLRELGLEPESSADPSSANLPEGSTSDAATTCVDEGDETWVPIEGVSEAPFPSEPFSDDPLGESSEIMIAEDAPMEAREEESAPNTVSEEASDEESDETTLIEVVSDEETDETTLIEGASDEETSEADEDRPLSSEEDDTDGDLTPEDMLGQDRPRRSPPPRMTIEEAQERILSLPIFQSRDDGMIDFIAPDRPLPWPSDASDTEDFPEPLSDPMGSDESDVDNDLQSDLADVDGDPDEGSSKEKSGRRRRRRSRRKKSGEAAETSESVRGGELEDPRAPLAASTDEAVGFDQNGESFSSDTEAAADLGSGSSESPLAAFADWNVPTWQELIASLYRPRR